MLKAGKSWKVLLSLILILTLTGCGASAPAGTDTVQWFNNTYAVLTVLNDRDYTQYSGGPADIKNEIIARTLLENTWDVTDRETANNPFHLDWNTTLEKTWQKNISCILCVETI